MILKLVVGVALMGSLVGCSTTQPPTTTGQLQIRVAQIESQLDDQNRDIVQLKSSVEDLEQRERIARISSPPVFKKAQLIEKSQPLAIKTLEPESNTSYQQILRVPVTPQDVQKRLKNAGYYTGAIDGKLGSASKRAIKEFQTDHDLESDGIIGKKTWDELKNYLE